MKYLKYLLYLIIVLVIIFIGNGFITPSISYESEVTVNKSAEEAWAVMSDESILSDWINGYKRMEPVSGTPNTVGAVSNIFVEDSGEEMMMVETITALEENNKIAMTFTMDFMNMDYEMLLKEKEGKTIISTKSKVTGNGIIAKSIISFISSSMKKQEDENLNNLKKLIDENTKNYFPEPVHVSSEEAVEL